MRRRRDEVRRRPDFAVPDSLLDRILTEPVTLSLEDRRIYNPMRELAPPRAYPRDAARITVKSSPARSQRYDTLSARVGFAVPERVAMCVRRKQRREVIHALRKNGSGGSRRRRRTIWSDVDCK